MDIIPDNTPKNQLFDVENLGGTASETYLDGLQDKVIALQFKELELLHLVGGYPDGVATSAIAEGLGLSNSAALARAAKLIEQGLLIKRIRPGSENAFKPAYVFYLENQSSYPLIKDCFRKLSRENHDLLTKNTPKKVELPTKAQERKLPSNPSLNQRQGSKEAPLLHKGEEFDDNSQAVTVEDLLDGLIQSIELLTEKVATQDQRIAELENILFSRVGVRTNIDRQAQILELSSRLAINNKLAKPQA
jgi:DNA-binding Lrp family transcriptional regulator